uniref:ULP_PROTEASE domain-containing protein n=1 Tax=Ganoderma boninense TaxID=34458 RepID=A0A5K1JV56_9APHY|nr:ULP_PROTEASE domain-containing protein [Ganoderma boninense]
MYYNAPIDYAVAASHYLYTTAQASQAGMYSYPVYPNHPYLNHRWSVVPQQYNHHWQTAPQLPNYRWPVVQQQHRHRAVPQMPVLVPVTAPEVIYSTPRPAAPYTSRVPYPQPRGLLVDTYKAPTLNKDLDHAPRPSANPVLYSSSSVPPPPPPSRPVTVYDTRYIRSLNWPTLGPQKALPIASVACVRGGTAPKPQSPGEETTLRIAFDLKRRILRKEGIPLSFLMQEEPSTLKRVVDRPYEEVLPASDGDARTITFRFWVSAPWAGWWLRRGRLPIWQSPIHPYPLQEYKVTIDLEGGCMTRLALAMHVKEVYELFFKAAACAPLSVSRHRVSDDEVLTGCAFPARTAQSDAKGALKATIIRPRAVSMGHLWLVSLRGTEREGVYDVCVQNHGPRASSLW